MLRIAIVSHIFLCNIWIYIYIPIILYYWMIKNSKNGSEFSLKQYKFKYGALLVKLFDLRYIFCYFLELVCLYQNIPTERISTTHNVLLVNDHHSSPNETLRYWLKHTVDRLKSPILCNVYKIIQCFNAMKKKKIFEANKTSVLLTYSYGTTAKCINKPVSVIRISIKRCATNAFHVHFISSSKCKCRSGVSLHRTRGSFRRCDEWLLSLWD